MHVFAHFGEFSVEMPLKECGSRVKFPNARAKKSTCNFQNHGLKFQKPKILKDSFESGLENNGLIVRSLTR